MSSVCNSYCHVCGVDVKPSDENGKDILITVFVPRQTRCVKISKTRKNKDQKGEIEFCPMDSPSKELLRRTKSKQGKHLEKIVEMELQYNPTYNFICSKCENNIDQYAKLSEELESLRYEVTKAYSTSSQLRNMATQEFAIHGNDKSLRPLVRSRRLRKSNNSTRNKLHAEDRDSESSHDQRLIPFHGHTHNGEITHNDHAILSDKQNNEYVETSNSSKSNINTLSNENINDMSDNLDIGDKCPNKLGDCTNSNESAIKNTTLSRRSIRIKASTATILEEGRKQKLKTDSSFKQSSQLPLERNIEDGKVNKNPVLCQIIEPEDDLNDKCLDIKKLHLRQSSTMDKNIAHPCEICK